MTTTNTDADIKVCVTCRTRPREPGQRKCKQCHAEYMRDWRLKQTTIRLTDDNYEYLRRRSFNERVSMSRLINQAIAEDRVRRETDVSRETKHR